MKSRKKKKIFQKSKQKGVIWKENKTKWNLGKRTE